mmetsp:Transcript_47854/g.104351  ORF Transcript_47854/g.104351 Transcript_47854/m.104351 type:complete len:210 (-) Transcript_47854:397-1026(-)
MSLEVPLQVLCYVIGLHGQVEFANVLLKLLGSKEHAEKEPWIDIRQGLVANGINSILVILLPQLGITQHLICLGQLLKLSAGLRIILILIRVQFQSHFVVVFLDLRGSGIGLHLQDVVKGGICHLPAGSGIIPTFIVGGFVLHGFGLGPILTEVAEVIDPQPLLCIPTLPSSGSHLQSLRSVVDTSSNLGGTGHDSSESQADGAANTGG